MISRTQYKLLITVLGAVVYIIYDLSTKSSGPSCTESANEFKRDFECNLVVKGKSNNQYGLMALIGKDLKTDEEVKSTDDTRWINNNIDTFKVGDTVIKKRDQYSILVKRKGKAFKIICECNDALFTDHKE